MERLHRWRIVECSPDMAAPKGTTVPHVSGGFPKASVSHSIMKKSFGKKIPPSILSRKEKTTSDSVGSRLEGKNESEHSKLPVYKTQMHKIKHKSITYIATHNINSLLKTGKLKNFTDELDR
ncbi:hypothetical protein J6590_057641 [Homalodisca vitripennis]|nr:hypothetical protein J6590_057641 [Homalodisca vitripennis]